MNTRRLIHVFLGLAVFTIVFNLVLQSSSRAESKPLMEDTFVNLIAQTKPGVVHLKVWQQYYDKLRDQYIYRETAGSGMLVRHTNGEIKVLTNKHVVENAMEIKLIITSRQGEKKAKGVVENLDTYTDYALVKIETEDPRFLIGTRILPFGDSDKVREGEWVLAIGNPLGFSFTSQKGMVSAVGRYAVIGYDIPPHDFIQIDADINPGNSGGPLINLRGEVVGTVTAIASMHGGSVGIGLAIPINIGKDFLTKRALSGEKIGRAGWIGIVTQETDKELLELFGHPKESRGIIVVKIEPESPAQNSGIKQGDLIVSVRSGDKEEELFRPNDLERVIAALVPGKTVEIKYMRGGKILRARITVVPRPSS